ncbi:xanthotoxin 5-hydroxylase CYP82C2-like [Hibiscus syriacus]|uniref:xanthotoxin 5-hydroxylase CYP82C2-like n=1 Tax=Hibiscus syriacus TaxID=106335 RepID=UPI0019225631|nr:xanthotoxin 5-hydroxylase CYP82C2-like [Hibiscus syriacus]
MAFASLPRTLAAELLGFNFAMFGFSPYGPYWRHIRKIATLELLSNSRLEKLKHVRESEAKESINRLYVLVINGGSKPVVVEMKRWFWIININTVLKIVIWKRYSEVENSHGEEENEERRKAVRDFFGLGGGRSQWRTRCRSCGGWIWKFRQTGGEHDDFMDIMLSFLEDAGKLPSYDADTINKATCQPPVLAHHLENVVEPVHIDCAEKESDIKFEDDHMSLFRPERFLTTHKHINVRGQNFEFIPFGSGRKVCPGISSALQILNLNLAVLLQSFEITTPDDEPVDIREGAGLTNLKAAPLNVVFTPRLPPHLYE